jgi:hypothetical protein
VVSGLVEEEKMILRRVFFCKEHQISQQKNAHNQTIYMEVENGYKLTYK